MGSERFRQMIWQECNEHQKGRSTTRRNDHPSGRASTIHKNIDGMSPAKGCPKWKTWKSKNDSTMTITAQGPIRFKRNDTTWRANMMRNWVKSRQWGSNMVPYKGHHPKGPGGEATVSSNMNVIIYKVLKRHWFFKRKAGPRGPGKKHDGWNWDTGVLVGAKKVNFATSGAIMKTVGVSV